MSAGCGAATTCIRKRWNHPHSRLLDAKPFFHNLDLLHHRGGVAGVAREDPHRQRLAGAVGQQPDDDLELAALAVAGLTIVPQGVVLAFQAGAGDAVEEQGGRGVWRKGRTARSTSRCALRDWSVLRFRWARRGVHPPLSIYWYDGGKHPPEEIPGGKGGMVWIGTKGSLPAGRGPFAGAKAEPYATPEPTDWNRKDVHGDWVAAIREGRQATCHFGFAGPFTEAYQLGNIALRVGHRIEWDPLAFRITNCQEANRYLHREDRRGWELSQIAGDAWRV